MVVRPRKFLLESSGGEKTLIESGIDYSPNADRFGKTDDGLMKVEGIPCTILDKKNSNGRIYTTEVMQEAIDRLKESNAFELRKLICTADDHPCDSLVPKPINASHVVVDAYIEKVDGESVLFNDWIILPTYNGIQLQKLIESRVTLGTSIRGSGTMDSSGRVSNYQYYGTDVVGLPSANTYFRLTESVSGKSEVREMEKTNKKIIEMAQRIARLERLLKLERAKNRRLGLRGFSERAGSDVLIDDDSPEHVLAVFESIIRSMGAPNIKEYLSPTAINSSDVSKAPFI